MPEIQLKLLKCQQCSAALHPRPGQPLFRCAFCGSSYLVEGVPTATDPAPLRWMPFAVSSDAARSALDVWLASGFLRPGDLARTAVVSEPQPVLVPVYLGRARAHSNWSAEVLRASLKKLKVVVPPGTEIKIGDGMKMRADSHLIAGAHDADYENVFLLASRGLSEDAFASMANYDWQRLEPMVGSADVASEEPTVSAGEAMRQIRHRLEDAERTACQTMVPGGGKLVDLRVNTVIQDLRVDLVYVPVWVCAYQYQSRPYRALVNGQTAKVGGDSPLSFARTALAVASVIALPAVIAWYVWRRRPRLS